MIEINENSFENKKYFYKNNGKRHLLIVLNTHNQGDRYFGFKTLLEAKERVDLLFLVDPNNKYYLDDNNGKNYINLINKALKNYDIENVSIFGTSMAGFAALNFGMELKLNVISINPQINLQSAQNLAWPALKETLSKLESQCDLEKIIVDKYSGQSLFLTFGQHRLDKQAYEEFMALNIMDISVNIRIIDSVEHKFFVSDLVALIDIHFLGLENRRLNNFIKA